MDLLDAEEAWEMYNISPELTCTCDDFHICQQCSNPEETKKEFNFVEVQLERKRVQARFVSEEFYNKKISFKEFRIRMNRVLNQIS